MHHVHSREYEVCTEAEGARAEGGVASAESWALEEKGNSSRGWGRHFRGYLGPGHSSCGALRWHKQLLHRCLHRTTCREMVLL